jgi:hypothetical protein
LGLFYGVLAREGLRVNELARLRDWAARLSRLGLDALWNLRRQHDHRPPQNEGRHSVRQLRVHRSLLARLRDLPARRP